MQTEAALGSKTVADQLHASLQEGLRGLFFKIEVEQKD